MSREGTSRPRSPQELLTDLGARLTHYSLLVREAISELDPAGCGNCRAAHQVLSRQYTPPRRTRLSRADVMELLGISLWKVNDLIHQGKLVRSPDPAGLGPPGFAREDVEALRP